MHTHTLTHSHTHTYTHTDTDTQTQTHTHTHTHTDTHTHGPFPYRELVHVGDGLPAVLVLLVDKGRVCVEVQTPLDLCRWVGRVMSGEAGAGGDKVMARHRDG